MSITTQIMILQSSDQILDCVSNEIKAMDSQIIYILKKENPKIESFPPSANLALDNIYLIVYDKFYFFIILIKR